PMPRSRLPRARGSAIRASASRRRRAARPRRSRSARTTARPCAFAPGGVGGHYLRSPLHNRRMASVSALPLAVTMGDACGIGPEIVAKWFRSDDAGNAFVVGDVGVLRRAAAATGGMLPVVAIDRPADVATLP